MVMCKLTSCANTSLRKCSTSEIRRFRYAKYFMMNTDRAVFLELIHGVDVETINVFMELLAEMSEKGKPVLLIVSNMEHALLLGDTAYKLQKNGLHPIEVVKEKGNEKEKPANSPVVANLFKVPAKLEDKMILFDPTEIDYIESQSG